MHTEYDQKSIPSDTIIFSSSRSTISRQSTTKILKHYPTTESSLDQLKAHFTSWQSIENPFVAKLYEPAPFLLDKTTLCLGLTIDRMSSSLKDQIDENIKEGKTFPKELYFGILQRVLSIFCYLEKIRIPARNIKPSNFLYSLENKLKISDLANPFMSEDMQSCSPQLAPELRGESRSATNEELFAADIWRLGILFIELATNTFVSDFKDEIALLQKVRELYGEALATLIISMLSQDPKKRPCGREVLSDLKEIMRASSVKELKEIKPKKKESKIEEEKKEPLVSKKKEKIKKGHPRPVVDKGFKYTYSDDGKFGDGKFDKTEILITQWNLNSLKNAISFRDRSDRGDIIALGDVREPGDRVEESREVPDGISPGISVESPSETESGYPLLKYLKETNPDIFCVTETHLTYDELSEEPIASFLKDQYVSFYNCIKAYDSGRAGTAIFTKVKPIGVQYDIGAEAHDQEGRTITLEFEKFFLVNSYVPNAGRELQRLEYRTKEWDPDFRNFLMKLKSTGKAVVLCGDLNVAHNEIDLHQPKRYAGFTIEERTEFGKLLDLGFVDTFRHLYPKEVKYSFFASQFDSRPVNKGWRLDYFIVNKEIIGHVKDVDMKKDVLGSDHVPCEMKFSVGF